METCLKILVDPGIAEVDCEGCAEKPFCGMRSLSLLNRYNWIMPRIQHLAWLYEARDLIGNLKLSAWELRGLIVFNRAVLAAQQAEIEMEEKLRKQRDA